MKILRISFRMFLMASLVLCSESQASEPTRKQNLIAVSIIINTLLLQDDTLPPVDSTGRMCWRKTERLNTDRLAMYGAAVETIDSQVRFCRAGNYERTKEAFERRVSCDYDALVGGSYGYYGDLKKQLRNCQYDEFSERG